MRSSPFCFKYCFQIKGILVCQVSVTYHLRKSLRALFIFLNKTLKGKTAKFKMTHLWHTEKHIWFDQLSSNSFKLLYHFQDIIFKIKGCKLWLKVLLNVLNLITIVVELLYWGSAITWGLFWVETNWLLQIVFLSEIKKC